MNVAQLLLRGAERNPAGLALKYGADAPSYPQLADRVQRLTRGLHPHAPVKEASVVGAPSWKWSESVVSFVVLHPGATATTQELIEHCRRNLASYKKPSQILFIDDLPKNATRKVLKRELRDSPAEANAG